MDNHKTTGTVISRIRDAYEVTVIGAGPAGLAAAIGAREAGCRNILLIDRENHLGGILQQCIHPGFGLKSFKCELTGPEYAYRFISKLKDLKIDYLTDTFVYSIDKKKTLLISNPGMGLREIRSRAVVLAMGCREGTRGSAGIPGFRPAGIFTAGTAQRLINIDGLMVGKKVVVLGSGDIGLIMARRCTIEGAEVKAVIEILPYPGGLNRNVVQCLEDFNIPLLLNHTINFIHGKKRLTGVQIVKVGKNGEAIDGTEKHIDCDTILLSVGLIPENELSRQVNIPLDPDTRGPVVDNMMQTEVDGFFACGNVVHVYDLVDHVSQDSYIAGQGAAGSALGKASRAKKIIQFRKGEAVKNIVPQIYRDHGAGGSKTKLSLRVGRPFGQSKIIFRCGKKVIGQIKKPYAVPSEMLRLDISKLIENIKKPSEVEISVEESN